LVKFEYFTGLTPRLVQSKGQFPVSGSGWSNMR
jgi:hypothetical protein